VLDNYTVELGAQGKELVCRLLDKV
jgi:hypothetical protein